MRAFNAHTDALEDARREHEPPERVPCDDEPLPIVSMATRIKQAMLKITGPAPSIQTPEGEPPTVSDPGDRLDYFLATPQSIADYKLAYEEGYDFKVRVPKEYFDRVNALGYEDHAVETRQTFGETVGDDYADETFVRTLDYSKYLSRLPRRRPGQAESVVRNTMARYNRAFFGEYKRSRRQLTGHHESVSEAIVKASAVGDIANATDDQTSYLLVLSNTISKWAKGPAEVPFTHILDFKPGANVVPVVLNHDIPAIIDSGTGSFISQTQHPEVLYPGYRRSDLEWIGHNSGERGDRKAKSGFSEWVRFKPTQVILKNPMAPSLVVDVDPRDPEPWLDRHCELRKIPKPDYYEYPIRDDQGGLLRHAPSDRPNLEASDDVYARYRLRGGVRGGRGSSSKGGRGRGRGVSQKKVPKKQGQAGPAERKGRDPGEQPAASHGARSDVLQAQGEAQEALRRDVEESVADEAETARLMAIRDRQRALEATHAAERRKETDDMIREYRAYQDEGLEKMRRIVEQAGELEGTVYGLPIKEYLRDKERYDSAAVFFSSRFDRLDLTDSASLNKCLGGICGDMIRSGKLIFPMAFVEELLKREMRRRREAQCLVSKLRDQLLLIKNNGNVTKLDEAVASCDVRLRDMRGFLRLASKHPFLTLYTYGPRVLAAALAPLALLGWRSAPEDTAEERPMSDRKMYGHYVPTVIPIAEVVEPVCLGFPPESKRPGAGHTMVPLESRVCDRPPEGKFGVQVFGPIFAHPESANPCSCNCQNSLLMRHLVERPEPKAHVFTDAAAVLCATIAKVFQHRVADSHSTRFATCGSRLVATNMEPKRARNNLESHMRDTPDPTVVVSFLKAEIGRHNPHDSPIDKGRAIMGHKNGATKVQLATEFEAYQKSIAETMDVDNPYEFKGGDGAPTGVFLSMASGADPDALARWAKLVAALSVAYYERDAKTYDACINEFMTEIKLWLAERCDPALADFMARSVNVRGWMRSKGGSTIEYTTDNTTKSGHNDTTSSNTLFNAIITGNAMLRAGVKGYVLVAGDDMLMAITDMCGRDPAEVKAELMKHESDQGIVPKAAMIGDITCTNFISACFLEDEGEYYFCPLIGRQVSKLNATVNRVHKKNLKKHIAGLAHCFDAFKHMLIIGSLIRPGPETKFVPMGDQEYGAAKWRKSRVVARDRAHGLRLLGSRYRKFGISDDALLDFDTFISQLPMEPLACSHPVANDLMLYDMGLGEREEACPALHTHKVARERPDHSAATRRFKPGIDADPDVAGYVVRAQRMEIAQPAGPGPIAVLFKLLGALFRLMQRLFDPSRAGTITLAVNLIRNVFRNDQEQIGRPARIRARQEVADASSVPAWGSREDSDPDGVTLPHAEDGVPPDECHRETSRGGQRELGSDPDLTPVGQYCTDLGGGAPRDGLCEPRAGELRVPCMPAEPREHDCAVQRAAENRGRGSDDQQRFQPGEERSPAQWVSPHGQVIHSPHDSIRLVQQWVRDVVPVRLEVDPSGGVPAERDPPLCTLFGNATPERGRDHTVLTFLSGLGGEAWGLRAPQAAGGPGLRHPTTLSREVPRVGCGEHVSSARGLGGGEPSHQRDPGPVLGERGGGGGASLDTQRPSDGSPARRPRDWGNDLLREHIPRDQLRGDDYGDCPCELRVHTGGELTVPDDDDRAGRARPNCDQGVLRGGSANATRVPGELQRPWTRSACSSYGTASRSASHTKTTLDRSAHSGVTTGGESGEGGASGKSPAGSRTHKRRARRQAGKRHAPREAASGQGGQEDRGRGSDEEEEVMCRSGPIDWRPRHVPGDQARPPPWLMRRLGLPMWPGLGQPGDMGRLPSGHWVHHPPPGWETHSSAHSGGQPHDEYPGDGYASRAGWGGHSASQQPAYAGVYHAEPSWGCQWGGGSAPLPGPPNELGVESFYPPGEPPLCDECRRSPGEPAFYPHECGRISTSTDRWTEPPLPLHGDEDGFELSTEDDEVPVGVYRRGEEGG